MRRSIPRKCRTEAIVHALVEDVWHVIADVTRTSEWSHECYQVTWLDGATAATPGARFRGRNRSGRLRWSRTCEVVTLDAPHEIAWRTLPTLLFPDCTEWRITLEPIGTETRIVQTYQLMSMTPWFTWIVARVNPRHLDRADALDQDLHRLGRLASSLRRAQPDTL
jgi:hypothetical protein